MKDDNKKVTRKRFKSVLNTNTFEQGKLPSQDINLEESVLGGILIFKQCMFMSKSILTPSTFYKECNQIIYEACLILDEQSQPIDILTVSNQLQKTGQLEIVGGNYYISQLTNSATPVSNIEFHSIILKQHEVKRRHVEIGSDLVNQGYDSTVDIMDTNEMISKKANELMNIIEPNKQKSNVDLVREVMENMERASKSDGITGIPSGFLEQDNITGGWQPGDLIYIAARPSMGKTAKVLCEAKNMAIIHKKHVAFFSLEMQGERLMRRLVSAETSIPLKKISKGEMDGNDMKKFHEGVKPLMSDKLHIFDNIKTIHGVKSKCLELHIDNKLDVIIIDYLQLIEHPQFKNNREREVSEISRTLKLMAMELNIPVICLSQLSREVEKRPNKKPQLSDLRDSGSIEQDADVVMFLFRPAYYNIPDSPEDLALGLIRKNRNGELATLKFKFEGEFVRFSDYESDVSSQFPKRKGDLAF